MKTGIYHSYYVNNLYYYDGEKLMRLAYTKEWVRSFVSLYILMHCYKTELIWEF